MYLIRLASGEERTFATIEELAAAVQSGEVERDAAIFHRRTKQWLPLEHHPYFTFATGEYKAPSAPDRPETRSPPGDEAPAPASLLDEEERLTSTPSNVAPLRPGPPAAPRAAPPPVNEPIAPTPLRMGRTEPRPPEPARRPESRPRIETAPQRSEAPAGTRPARRRTGLVIAIIIILGSAIGILLGLKLRNSAGGRIAAEGPSFRPAPPPSSILGDSAGAAAADSLTRGRARPGATRRIDPTAPVNSDQLMDRREQTFLNAQAQLGRDLAAVDFNGIFGVRALSSPDGARAARRVVASALNVVGQFHRREVMADRAYEDTAAYQTTRAGWTRDQITAWDHRPTLKEPYQSADLAESLLADADSLLSILGSGTQWTVEGDSLRFVENDRAAAYRAQRQRITQRAGPPVVDTAARPALAYVRGAVNPALLPPATE